MPSAMAQNVIQIVLPQALQDRRRGEELPDHGPGDLPLGERLGEEAEGDEDQRRGEPAAVMPAPDVGQMRDVVGAGEGGGGHAGSLAFHRAGGRGGNRPRRAHG